MRTNLLSILFLMGVSLRAADNSERPGWRSSVLGLLGIGNTQEQHREISREENLTSTENNEESIQQDQPLPTIEQPPSYSQEDQTRWQREQNVTSATARPAGDFVAVMHTPESKLQQLMRL